MVKILICICSNDINKLKITITSLYKLSLLGRFKVSILVVDNSSNNKIKNYIKSIKKKKI